MSARVGDIVLVREDRHTDRAAHEAHVEAGGDPAANPAPLRAWYWPLIVTTVHASGAVSGDLFQGRRGTGHQRKVQPGDRDGCYVEKPAATTAEEPKAPKEKA